MKDLEMVMSVVTAIISVALVLLGLKEDISNKKTQLLFVLGSYIIITGIVFGGFENKVMIVSLFVIFIFGGLAFMSQSNQEMEKELNHFQLLFYSSLATFFMTFQSIQVVFVLFLLLLRQILDVSDSTVYILIGIIMIIHYTIVNKDFFGFYDFKLTINKWKQNYTLNISRDNLDKEIELMTFVLYMEDKNFIYRKKPYLQPKELFNKFLEKFKSKSKNNNRILFRKLRDFSGKKSGTVRCFKKYIRGYSTIEQQFIRQFALKDYSYRYTFRRKIFIERIYLAYLLKAMKIRKSRSLSRNPKKRKQLQEQFRLPMKIYLLCCYFELVMKHPDNIETLINKLQDQSRLNKKVILNEYQKFMVSDYKSEVSNIIKLAMTAANLELFK